MSNAIATNAAANSAVSYLSRNSEMQSSSIAKLSSGSRIVKASDDAASLAVGTKLKADVTALKQASANADQAASLMQVADGALSRVSDTLIRMKSLATQARSDALTTQERSYLDEEFSELKSQIDFISTSTKFNDEAVIGGGLGSTNVGAGALAGATVDGAADTAGTYDVIYTAGDPTMTVTATAGALSGQSQTVAVDGTDNDFSSKVDFNGMGVTLDFQNFDLTATGLTAGTDTLTTTGGAALFQVGVSSAEDITVNIDQTNATTLGVNLDDITSIANAAAASTNIDNAIESVNTKRANLGANMSRMEKIGDNLATTTENLDAARSTLMDVDVAAEMTEFSKNQVMTQASTAMLAQANQLPQNLMRLLQ